MAIRSKLDTGYKPAAIDQARLFAQGFEFPVLTDRDQAGFLGITQVGGISIARGDKTTYPLQTSDTGEVVERTAAQGPFETQTGTWTQYLDEALDEPWYKAVKRNAPGRFIIPIGTNRSLQDINSFTTFIVVDQVYIKTETIDDNINQPDAGTVGTPLNISGDFEYDPRNVHWGYGLVFTEENIGTMLDRTVVAGVHRLQADGGINYFITTGGNAVVAATTGATAPAHNQAAVTAAAPKVIGRNAYDEWQSAVTIGAATDLISDMAVAGGSLILIGHDKHFVVNADDVLAGDATAVEVTDGYTAGKSGTAISVLSVGEIIIVGEAGNIYKSTSPTSAPVIKDGGVATTQPLHDVDAYGDVVIAVGETGATVVSTDRGETWKLGTAAGSATLNAVAVHSENMAFAGAQDGKLYRTRDQGATWTAVSHGVAGDKIIDLAFLPGFEVTSGIGYMLMAEDTTAGSLGSVVARTIDGGITWREGSPHILRQPDVEVPKQLILREANSVMIVGGQELQDLDGQVALVEHE